MATPLPTESAQTEPVPLGTTVATIAGVLGSPEFPSGDRAKLKRQDPGQPPSLAFYRFAFRRLPAGWERQQRAWMTLIAGIALLGDGAHRPALALGKALAENGYAESRLERLLAADGDTQSTLVLRAYRFLAAKNLGCNQLDFARLLLSTNPETANSARLAIARAFYSNLKRQRT